MGTASFNYECREWREWTAGDSFPPEGTELATPKAWSTERETEEKGSEEMAGRHLLQPVGGYPPEDREGSGRGKVSVNVNREF